jgi:hypothetical protein
MSEWTLDFPIKTDFLNASDIKMAENSVFKGISQREQNGTLNNGRKWYPLTLSSHSKVKNDLRVQTSRVYHSYQ